MPSAPRAARQRGKLLLYSRKNNTKRIRTHVGVSLTCKQAQRFDFLYHRISLNGSLVGAKKLFWGNVLLWEGFPRGVKLMSRTTCASHGGYVWLWSVYKVPFAWEKKRIKIQEEIHILSKTTKKNLIWQNKLDEIKFGEGVKGAKLNLFILRSLTWSSTVQWFGHFKSSNATIRTHPHLHTTV